MPRNRNPNNWKFFPGDSSGKKPIYRPPQRSYNSDAESQSEQAARQSRNINDYESMKAGAVGQSGLDYNPVWANDQAYNTVVNRYTDLTQRINSAFDQGLLEPRDLPSAFRKRDLTPEQGQSYRRLLEARLEQVESSPNWAREQITNRRGREEALANYYTGVVNPFLQEHPEYSAHAPFVGTPGNWSRDQSGNLEPGGDANIMGEAAIRLINNKSGWSANLNVMHPDPSDKQAGTLFVNGQAMRPMFPGIKGASPTSFETQQQLFTSLFSSGRNPNDMVRDEQERMGDVGEYSASWHSMLQQGEGGPGAMGKMRHDWHLPNSYMLVGYETPEIRLMKGGEYKNPYHQGIADQLKENEVRVIKNREEFLTQFGLTARKGSTSTVTSLEAFATGSGTSIDYDEQGNPTIYGIGETDLTKALKRARLKGMYEQGFGEMSERGFNPDSRRTSSMFVTQSGDMINSYRMRQLRFLGSAGGFFGEGQAIFNTGAARNQGKGVGQGRVWEFDLPTNDQNQAVWGADQEAQVQAQLATQLQGGTFKVGDQSFDLGKNWENSWVHDYQVQGNKLLLRGYQAGAAMSNKSYMKEFLQSADLNGSMSIDGQNMSDYDIAGPISGDIMNVMYGTLDVMQPQEMNQWLSTHMDTLRHAAEMDEANRETLLNEANTYQSTFFDNGAIRRDLKYNSTTLPLLMKAFTKTYLPSRAVNVAMSQNVSADSLDQYLSDRSGEQTNILNTFFGGDASNQQSWLNKFNITDQGNGMYNVQSMQPAFDLPMGANFRAEMSGEDTRMNDMIRRARYMYGDPNERGALDVIGGDIASQAGGLIGAAMANAGLSNKGGMSLEDLSKGQISDYINTRDAALKPFGENATQAQLVNARMAGLQKTFGASMISMGDKTVASPEAMSRFSAYNDTGEQVGLMRRYTEMLDARMDQLTTGETQGLGGGEDLDKFLGLQAKEASTASTRAAALGSGRTDAVGYMYNTNSRALAANEMVMNTDRASQLIAHGLTAQGVDSKEAHQMARQMALSGNAVLGATRNPSLDVAQATTNMALVTPDQFSKRGGLFGSLFKNQAIVNPLWSAHQRGDVDADALSAFWAGTVLKDNSGQIMRDAQGKVMYKQAQATSSERIIQEALNAPGGEYMNQMKASISPKQGETHEAFVERMTDAMIDEKGQLKGISGEALSGAASKAIGAAGNMGEFYNWGRGFEVMSGRMGFDNRIMSRMSSEAYQVALDEKTASGGAQLLQKLTHGSPVTGYDLQGPMWNAASPYRAGNLHEFSRQIFAGMIGASEFSPEEAAYALTPGGQDPTEMAGKIASARAAAGDDMGRLTDFAKGLHNETYDMDNYFLASDAPATLFAAPGALKSQRKGQSFKNVDKSPNARANTVFEQLAGHGAVMNAAIRLEGKQKVSVQDIAEATNKIGRPGFGGASKQYLDFLEATGARAPVGGPPMADEPDVDAWFAATGQNQPAVSAGGVPPVRPPSAGGTGGQPPNPPTPVSPLGSGGQGNEPIWVRMAGAPKQLDAQDMWNTMNQYGDINGASPFELLSAYKANPNSLTREQGEKMMGLFQNVRKFGETYSFARRAEGGQDPNAVKNDFSASVMKMFGPGSGRNFEQSEIGKLYESMAAGNDNNVNQMMYQAGQAAGQPKTAKPGAYVNRMGFGTRDDDVAAGMAGALGESLGDLQKIMLKLTDSTRSLTKEEAAQVDVHGKLYDTLTERIDKAQKVIADDSLEEVNKAPARAFLNRLQGMSFNLGGDQINGLAAVEQVGGALQGPGGLTEQAVNQRRQGEYEFSDRDQSPFVRLLRGFTSHRGDAGERIASVFGSQSWEEMPGVARAANVIGAGAIGAGMTFMNNWWMMRHIASGLVNPVMQASDQYESQLRGQAGAVGEAGFGSAEITGSRAFLGANATYGARLRGEEAFQQASYQTWSPVQRALATPTVAGLRAIGEPAVGAMLGATWLGGQLAERGLMSQGAGAMLGPAAFAATAAFGVGSNIAEYGEDYQRQSLHNLQKITRGGPGATLADVFGSIGSGAMGEPSKEVQDMTRAMHGVYMGQDTKLNAQTMNAALYGLWAEGGDRERMTAMGVSQSTYMQTGALTIGLNRGMSSMYSTDQMRTSLMNQAAGVDINTQMQLAEQMVAIRTGGQSFGVGDQALNESFTDANILYGDNQAQGRIASRLAPQYAATSLQLSRIGQRSPSDFMRDVAFLGTHNLNNDERQQYSQNLDFTQMRGQLASQYEAFAGDEGKVDELGRAGAGYTGDLFSRIVRNMPAGMERTKFEQRAGMFGRTSQFYNDLGQPDDLRAMVMSVGGMWQDNGLRQSNIMQLAALGDNTPDDVTRATKANMIGVDWQGMVQTQMAGRDVQVGSPEQKKIVEDILKMFAEGAKIDLPKLMQDIQYEQYQAQAAQIGRQSGFGAPNLWRGTTEQYQGQLANTASVIRAAGDYGVAPYGAGYTAADEALKNKDYARARRITQEQERGTQAMDQYAPYGGATQKTFDWFQQVAASGDAATIAKMEAARRGDPIVLSQMAAAQGLNSGNAIYYSTQTGEFGGTKGMPAGYDENLHDPRTKALRERFDYEEARRGGIGQRAAKEAGMAWDDISQMNQIETEAAINTERFDFKQYQYQMQQKQMVRQRAYTTGQGISAQAADIRAAGGGAYAADAITSGGQWALEDKQRSLSYRQQDYGYEFEGRQLGLAQTRFDTSNRQWGEQMGLRERQMQYGNTYQQQEMTIGQQHARTQGQWQLQDIAFSRNRGEVQFGWQMEDFDRNLRYSRGRERVDLMRDRERAVISHAMDRSQSGREESHAKQQIQWQEEGFKRAQQHFTQEKQFQMEAMQLERRHHEENKTLEQQSMQMQREKYQQERQFMLESRQYDTQGRALQRAQALQALRDQEEMAKRAHESDMKLEALSQHLQSFGQAADRASRYTQYMVQTGQILDDLNPKLATFNLNLRNLSTQAGGQPAVTGGQAVHRTVVRRVISQVNSAGNYNPGGYNSGQAFSDGGFAGDPYASYAEGGQHVTGYTGQGSKYQYAGDVHAGEYVVPQHGALVVRGDGGNASYFTQMIDWLRKLYEKSTANSTTIINTNDTKTAIRAGRNEVDQAYSRRS